MVRMADKPLVEGIKNKTAEEAARYDEHQSRNAYCRPSVMLKKARRFPRIVMAFRPLQQTKRLVPSQRPLDSPQLTGLELAVTDSPSG